MIYGTILYNGLITYSTFYTEKKNNPVENILQFKKKNAYRNDKIKYVKLYLLPVSSTYLYILKLVRLFIDRFKIIERIGVY